MKREDIEELKECILKEVRFQLAYDYGFTNKEIDEMIQKSNLVESIEYRPTVYAHMSPEQVLDVVFYPYK